ncbi:MAG: hypothetical protein NTX06_06910 [Proteobacteria bacterium]|nr:hypothetical protein [Pseudomonadota bacterium]
MEKTLNILVVALIAAAGLQIAGVNFLTWNSSYMQQLKSVDLSALQAAYSVTTVLF